jgi:hypothetical protein
MTHDQLATRLPSSQNESLFSGLAQEKQGLAVKGSSAHLDSNGRGWNRGISWKAKKGVRGESGTKRFLLFIEQVRFLQRSLPFVPHRSWLNLSRLKLGCFLMLPHCMEQGDEALACPRCFGMVHSKYLLIHRQGTVIPDSGLLAVA